MSLYDRVITEAVRVGMSGDVYLKDGSRGIAGHGGANQAKPGPFTIDLKGKRIQVAKGDIDWIKTKKKNAEKATSHKAKRAEAKKTAKPYDWRKNPAQRKTTHRRWLGGPTGDVD